MIRNKIKGFTLIEMSVVVAVVGVLLVFGQKYLSQAAKDAQGQVVKKRIERVVESVERHYMDNVLGSGADPMNMNTFIDSIVNLQGAGYLENCSSADVIDGKCINYRYLPFGSQTNGEEIKLTRHFTTEPYAKLEFTLANESDGETKATIVSAISLLPGFSISGDVVSIIVKRPGQLAALSSFVTTDGTTPMTGHWNYGNKNLTGVADLRSTTFTSSSDANVGGDLDVTGNSQIDGNSTITGSSTVTGNSNVTGDSTVAGNFIAESLIEVQGSGINFTGAGNINNAQYITGVEELIIADRSLTSGLRWTGSVEVLDSGGADVRKPNCNAGLRPAIEVWPKVVGGSTMILAIGRFETRYQDSLTDPTNKWTLNIDVSAVVDGQSGYQWVNEGVVGFEIWCEPQ
ncbi:prepilin-type N-terminal cleavage/methylation domain-containing protein [Vibrio barjaei]|uniref:prepilin-type N-terminal cleavage/methylation domain-containing protein n=1 Tax=Vibrio barjaei TaxID=1676683 RepID=UPI002284ADE9|nr:prepilin-type N-terminal cleavage/methylation domain-containing protein [Vibrio barjaei]MCY9872989.1 prepilin-type N-terminal cleavage/methylation domain-containing protein [Vibrio barjaei]